VEYIVEKFDGKKREEEALTGCGIVL